MPARSRIRNKTMTSIDMTPLMDLTFMLLIIFVITVPVMEYLTDVTPPELNGRTSAEAAERPLVIALDHEGGIFLGDEKVAAYDLLDRLLLLRRRRGDVQLLLRADGARPYEDVVAVMRIAQKAGIGSVSLMTRAERSE